MKKLKNVGEVIEFLREEIDKSDLSASKVAGKMGVSRSYLCKALSSDRKAAGIEIYRRMAGVLGFDLDESFKITNKGKRNVPTES